MKRKSTRTQGIKRKIAILLSIAMLFTLAFTGTALAEEVTAYESVNYAELEEFLENGSPGDFEPNWGHSGVRSHLNLIRNGNTSGISATGVQLLESGMMMPDGRNRNNQDVLCPQRSLIAHRNAGNNTFNLRMPEFRSFHGYQSSRQNGVFAESNYVAAYSLITMIANRSGATDGLVNPGLTGGTGGALFNVRNRFRRIDGVAAAEGMRCGTCGLFMNWQQIMDRFGFPQYNNSASFRRHFIWGIALHAMADTFEHSALHTPASNQWRIIPDAQSDNSAHVAVRFNAAQDAVNAALRVIASGSSNNGCCCQFRAARGRFTGSNFRLANLTRYSNQNAVAVPHRGALTATERLQLRPGDIWFRTNGNRESDINIIVPLRCSIHNIGGCSAC